MVDESIVGWKMRTPDGEVRVVALDFPWWKINGVEVSLTEAALAGGTS